MAEEFDDADFLAAAVAVERAGAGQRTVGATNTLSGGAKVVQPKPQALPSRQGPSAVLVSIRQKGNPILNHIKGVPWEYSDIPTDYVLGATTCALFLSLKYHRLHPEYIYGRIRQLGKLYNLRVLLCMVDINNHEEALKELSKTSMINNLTLVLAWSAQEAGRYLELFKSYEHASPASIRARQAESYKEYLTDFVTTPRNINKTDAASLISNFGTLRAAVNAEPEELSLIPGWGEKKVKSWVSTVREPFRVKRAARSTNILRRQESSLLEGDAENESVAPDHSGSRLAPIPIASVPALSRESSTLKASSSVHDPPEPRDDGALRQERHMQVPLEDDLELDAEEEAALLAAADAEALRPAPLSSAQKAIPAAARRDPELSAGVAAALARLREKG